MHPPRDFCRALHDISPTLRVGWVGAPHEPGAEYVLNSGNFVIVELLPVRQIGGPDKRRTLQMYWDHDVPYAGPLFDKHGNARRDFDLSFVPVVIHYVTPDWGFTSHSLHDGSLLHFIKQHIMTVREEHARRKQALLDQGERLSQRLDDMTSEMTDHWLSLGRKDLNSGHVMARKHVKEELKQKYRDAMDGNYTERESIKTYFARKAGYDVGPQLNVAA